MPVHDWTRVISGIFHDFHQTWIPEIKNSLNAGILPDGFYAMVDQTVEGPRPDVIALEAEEGAWRSAESALGTNALAIAEHPPQVEYTEDVEREIYAEAADRVAVYHASGDRVVAYIEIVSPGNKHSEHEVEQFVEKLEDALQRGCHLLVIDVLPSTRHAPGGMHAALWEHLAGHAHTLSPERPFGLSAYRVQRVGDAGTVPSAYIQSVSLGAPLPDMPLFLTPRHYVNVPLEQTYMAAWQGVPKRWKDVIEGRTPHPQPRSTTDLEPRTTDTP